MDNAAAMKERQAADLAELAELGMAVARNLAASTLRADTPEDKAKLAAAFHRISRSVRQTHALHAKLSGEAVRERAVAARETAMAEAKTAQARVNAVKARVRSAVVRLIWDEHEADEAEALEDDLDGILYCGELTPDDLDASDAVLIARIAEQLGLPAPHSTPPGAGCDEATHAAAAEAEPRPPP